MSIGPYGENGVVRTILTSAAAGVNTTSRMRSRSITERPISGWRTACSALRIFSCFSASERMGVVSSVMNLLSHGMSARKRLAQRALFAAVLASFLTLALGAPKPEEVDFICFWNRARSLEQGLDPYDEAIWSPAIAALYEAPPGTVKTPPCPGRYAYPLWTAMAMVPFGLLPLVAASVAWMVLLLAGTGAGIALLARAARLERDDAVLFATIVLSSEPAWLTVRSAQFGGLQLAALGLLAPPATAAQPVRLTVASFLLLPQPHLTPLIVLERLRAASGRARAIAARALPAIVAGSLLVRPALSAEWLLGVQGQATSIDLT